MGKKRCYFLVGETASGKTSVAHYIAKSKKMPIISADSMLIYKGMDIGTAKPDRNQQQEVSYYGIDLINPWEDFSVNDYYVNIINLLKRTSFSEFIVVGGTGLYINVLLFGMSQLPKVEKSKRLELEGLYNDFGIVALKDRLQASSPNALEKLRDPNNPRRLIRAIEIVESGYNLPDDWTGMRKDSPIIPALSYDKDVLNARIEQRVYKMFGSGFKSEVNSLLAGEKSLSRTASQAIGYAEMIEHIKGNINEEEAIRRICTRTRQLAKRQRTWFRNKLNVKNIKCFDESVEDIAAKVLKIWDNTGPIYI